MYVRMECGADQVEHLFAVCDLLENCLKNSF